MTPMRDGSDRPVGTPVEDPTERRCRAASLPDSGGGEVCGADPERREGLRRISGPSPAAGASNRSGPRTTVTDPFR